MDEAEDGTLVVEISQAVSRIEIGTVARRELIFGLRTESFEIWFIEGLATGDVLVVPERLSTPVRLVVKVRPVDFFGEVVPDEFTFAEGAWIIERAATR